MSEREGKGERQTCGVHHKFINSLYDSKWIRFVCQFLVNFYWESYFSPQINVWI